MITVQTTGFKELEASLGQLKSATRKNVARRALRLAAEPVRAEWERLVPVDEGDLKRSIKAGNAIKSFQRPANKGTEVTQFIGIDESQDARLHIYAPIIEYGNSSHKAEPAGRPAWESKKMEALKLLSVTLKAEIDKAVARIARKGAKLDAIADDLRAAIE